MSALQAIDDLAKMTQFVRERNASCLWFEVIVSSAHDVCKVCVHARGDESDFDVIRLLNSKVTALGATFQRPMWEQFGYDSAEDMRDSAQNYLSRMADGKVINSIELHTLAYLDLPIEESLRCLHQGSERSSSRASSGSEGAGSEGAGADHAINTVHPAPDSATGTPVSKKARTEDDSTPGETGFMLPARAAGRRIIDLTTPFDPSSPPYDIWGNRMR
uniref:Uncharacterized protein n=1 Tax=Chlamydomonas leiostraca TaxID=1034604 RepID=A0A7S0RPC1_9CHLO|mmetsp:Transcript_27708/g.70600  ORF Transcript_27708/g.70600 Transcript_27708/m.70600 type:complete len:218 (+) Transcript_27708:509-1162(+)